MTLPNPIRWGILGASRFALNQMAPAIHSARGGCLQALATRNTERAEPFVAFAPAIRVFDDYQALLDDEQIDAVYIPLPNHLHVEWTRRAVEAGKHVLCEKPIALDTREIDDLIELRDRSGRIVAEAFMVVHHPQWQLAREWVASGEIGAVQLVDNVFTFLLEDRNNIRYKADTGGGALRDIGVYSFGCTRYVTGREPESIRHVDMVRDNGIDVYAQVSARFPGFHYASVDSIRLPRRQEFNIHGSAGLIRLTAPFNAAVFGEARVELHKPELDVRTVRFPGVNQYILQVENLNQAIQGNAELLCPLEFSRGTQAMMDAVFEAAG